MLRPWEFTVPLERRGKTALHIQITQAVIDDIKRGRLLPGTTLPGTRALAEKLAINRKTAVLAYEELQAQGWIDLQPRRGAVVSAQLPLQIPQPAKEVTPATFAVTPVTPALQQFITAVLPVKPTRDMLNFTDGAPDTRLIPYDEVSRAYRHALVSSTRTNQLGYGDPRGSEVLRASIAAMLRIERGLNVQTEHVCLVRGSQMGIYLSARLFARPGAHVVFETLSYPPAREAFRSCGATVHSIAQDSNGLIPEALEEICRQYPVCAIYVTPHHQYPTTVFLPPERRLRLLALAEQYNFTIVEDDYDHEFHYLHRPILPLASMNNSGRVLHIGSLSKVLAPGLRLGYAVASPQVIDRLAADIMLIDRQGNLLTELALHELMESGALRRHVRRALKIYRARRDHLAAVIRTELPEQVSFDLPAGGIALWVKVVVPVNLQRLANDCSQLGVATLPGRLFAHDERDVPAFRLGFGSLSEKELEQAISRFKSAFARQVPL